MTPTPEEIEEVKAVILKMNEIYPNNKPPTVARKDVIGPVAVYSVEFMDQNNDFRMNYATKRSTQQALAHHNLEEVAAELNKTLDLRGFIISQYQTIVLSVLGLILAIGVVFGQNALIPVLTAIVGFIAGKNLPNPRP
jgi:hypothetical protein